MSCGLIDILCSATGEFVNESTNYTHTHTHTHTHVQCFSSIVGPNGSGKSNVIDSMLFVFGYRARKIRSKKVAVLIHNSEHHQNVQSCTVSVHFQKIIDKVSLCVCVCVCVCV